jgi:tRNA threonylcarbamoyladenosine biosynthesis protein TsaB
MLGFVNDTLPRRVAGLRLLSLCTSGIKSSVFATSVSSTWQAQASAASVVYQEAGKESASVIFRMIDEALAAANFDDFDLICFDKGPGAFTGVRIGCGVAQGLGFGKNCPVIGVNSLEALALATTLNADEHLSFVAVDARMGEVYCAAYRFGEGGALNLLMPTVCRPDQAISHFQSIIAQNSQMRINFSGNAFDANSIHPSIALWASDGHGDGDFWGKSISIANLHAEQVAIAGLSILKIQGLEALPGKNLSMLQQAFPAVMAAPEYVRNSVALDKEQQAQLRLLRSHTLG